ncbi:MAG: hypothetical protein OCC49_18265 [Fibrobacterales bacterium]
MIDEEQQELLKLLGEESVERGDLYKVNSFYWEWLNEIVRNEVEDSSKIELTLDDYKKQLNFGFLDPKIIESEEVIESVNELCDGFDILLDRQYYFTDWLDKKFNEILKFKEIEDTEEQIGMLKDKREKLDLLILNFQKERASIVTTQSRKPDPVKIELLNNKDDAFLQSLIRKAEVASGHNMTPEERREHLKKEEELNGFMVNSESILSEIEDDNFLNKVKQLSKNVELSIEKIIETKKALSKADELLEKLNSDVAAISMGELQNRMGEEVNYLKGLVKLSANRVKAESIAVLHGKNQIITFEFVNELFELIEEFDSKLYQNHKVAYIGKPDIVIVPGKGHGMYDWKNNALIIPVMPYTSKEQSVINAIVEYRIDMDEDKSLFNGFTGVKGNEGIKSTMDFRAKFTKEYIIWMTKEYKGYKVMTKEVRFWFEHEIGPNKQHILIPAKYVTPPMSSKDYIEKIKLLDQQVREQGDDCDPDVLYERAIAFCTEDAWIAARDLFLQLSERLPSEPTVEYNLGFLHSKTKDFKIAIDYFTRFIKANPSSWWAGVAKDNILRLR